MNFALIALGALLVASPCAASTWAKFATNADGMVFSIDLDSVRRVDKRTRKAWFKYDLPTSLRAGKDPVTQQQVLVHIRCADATLSYGEINSYGVAGDLRGSDTLPDGYLGYQDPPPDSTQALMVDAACAAKLQ